MDPASKVRRRPISVLFGSEILLRVHYCKRDKVYVKTLLGQNNGRPNGLIPRMLLSELQNIMVNKVTFVGFRVVYRPNRPPPVVPGSAPTGKSISY